MQSNTNHLTDFSIISTLEESISTFLADELPLFGIDVLDRQFVLAFWIHFFTHSSLAAWDDSERRQETSLNCFDYVPADTAAFMAICRLDEYMSYLRSTLNNTQIEHNIKPNRKNKVLLISQYYLAHTLLYNAGFSKKLSALLTIVSLGKINSFVKSRELQEIPIDRTKRIALAGKLKQRLQGYEFGCWFANRLIEFFPTIFLEDFERIAEIYRQHTGKIKVIFSRDCWSSDDSLKLLSVIHHNSGQAKILKIGAPHSLNYGCLRDFWLRDHETRHLDQYLTWGWTGRNVESFYPSQYACSGRPVYPKELPHDFEIVITGASRPAHTIEYPYSHQKFLYYLDNQIDLAQKLTVATGRAVTIRTRQRDRGSVLQNRLSSLESRRFKLEYQSGSLLRRLRKSLHISDNPSTAIIETLWAKHPTLLVMSPGYFELLPETSYEFNLLKSAGIFHNSVDSAVNFLVLNKDKLNQWWLSELTQTAITEFLKFQAKPGGTLREWKTKLLNKEVR